MKDLMTTNTLIERGEVEFNSPSKYLIRDRARGFGLLEVPIQKGPVQEHGINGVFIEDLLLICIDQIEHFQASEFSCVENEDTLRHLRDALNSTRSRQYERQLRNVQGFYKK